MSYAPSADSDYFGRRLREHDMVGISADDDAITALIEQLMSVEWVFDASAREAVQRDA